jgi:hypothetical protein
VRYLKKQFLVQNMNKINVLDKEITFYTIKDDDYISLTDIAKYKSPDTPADVIKNWTRRKDTIEFLGLWEKINNPYFKLVEFDQFKNQAGSNAFVLSPTKWTEHTKAIGLTTKSGKTGGTYANKDIAFEFASWISAEFKLYLIKEFQRLKIKENKSLEIEWNVKRQLAKINYKIHTNAIKENLIPIELTKEQINQIYANEVDVLNMALFGITAKEWRDKNKDQKGNIRDLANISQLVCLSNLENLNAHFINDGLPQPERLKKLNIIAISQMKLLTEEHTVKILGNNSPPL